MTPDELAYTTRSTGRWIKIKQDNENGCEMEYPNELDDGPNFEDTEAIADVFESK